MSVQEGMQYPNVVRVLKPGSSEWAWYDNGGTYPYPGEPTDDTVMQMVVRTTAPSETFTVPAVSGFVYDLTVYWGDGTADVINIFNDPAWTHTYAVAGDYTIKFSGVMTTIRFNALGDSLKVIDVLAWGKTGFTSMLTSFRGCANCVFTAGPACDTSAVTSFVDAFHTCTVGNPNVSQFQTDAATTIAGMFRDCPVANPDVSNWNNAICTDYRNIFNGCTMANPDVSGEWMKAAATRSEFMFRDCVNATPDVSGWSTGGLTESGNFCRNATIANPDIRNWDISLNTNMARMMEGSAFDNVNYDAALTAFAVGPRQSGVTAHFGAAQYTAATAKQVLTDDAWLITDGGENTALHALTANSTPVRNISGSTFDLVVDSNHAEEQVYAAVFASAVDAGDPVTVRNGRGALWSGKQTSVTGENIFNVTGVTPSGKFYGFAQEDYTPKETIVDYTVETIDEWDFKDKDMVPTQAEISYQVKFQTTTDSSSLATHSYVFILNSGLLASPTLRLFLRRNPFSNTLELISGTTTLTWGVWNFSTAQDIDIRVKTGFVTGTTVWVDGVKTEWPSENMLIEAILKSAYFPGNGALDVVPMILQRFRWVNESLTDAEIEAWS